MMTEQTETSDDATIARRAAITAMIADLAPYTVELHLSTDPDLPKKYGRVIKAAGGEYSEARGMSCLHRYVKLPSGARELINKLVAEFGFWHGARSNDKVTMIARPAGGYERSRVNTAVCYILKSATDPMAEFERQYVRHVLHDRTRGNFAPLTNAEVAVAAHREAEQVRIEAEKRTVAQRLYAGMPRSLVEFDVLVEALTQFVENNGDLDETDDAPGGAMPGWQAKTAAAQTLLDRCVAEICKNVE